MIRKLWMVLGKSSVNDFSERESHMIEVHLEAEFTC